jgi:hypothetical protein
VGLRWTTKSLRHLADELAEAGHTVSAPTVAGLLREENFILQGDAKRSRAATTRTGTPSWPTSTPQPKNT